MRPTVDVLELGDPEWRTFVAAHPATTCFHRPEWSQLLAECYGYAGFVAAHRQEDGTIAAGLPVLTVRTLSMRKRWASLPFSDECGPLAVPGASVDTLLDGVEELRRRARVDHLEVRTPLARDGWTTYRAGVVHSQPLPAAGDAVLGAFHSSARRNVRRAERAGVTVRHGTGPGDVDRFYAMHVRTRHRKGVPVQPRRYFRLLWEAMIRDGHGTLLLAEHDGATVAGAVFLTGGSTLTYKYGASDPEHWGVFPNNLVMYHAMRWGVDKAFTRFDWGRSDEDDMGLRAFKSTLGGQERELDYARTPVGAPPTGGGARALRPVLGRSPAWVGRAAGEVLYRFAG